MANKVLGIDLGTGNSCMAILEGNSATIITNAEGARTTPSIVAFTKTGERLVGQAAKRQAITNPKNTVYSIKRFIGRKFSEVSEEAKLMPYEIVEASNGDAHVKIDGKTYSPEEISSFILAKLKKDAEAFIGEEIKQAVITVPAYFNDSQRQATKNAGQIAGLDVLRIINEPTAAALAYGSGKTNKSGIVAIADAGCGTYDISILDVGDGVFEVMATNGDTHLGGDDVDQCIMKWLIDNFKTSNGVDLSKDNMALQRVKEESEKAKCALSTESTYNINLPFISADSNGPKHLEAVLTRSKLEQLCSSVIDRMEQPAKNCMKDAEKGTTLKIDEVLLVGGMTRMPCVQSKVKEIFGGIEPSKGINPDEAVAMGAAIQGGIIKGEIKDVLLLDVTPLTLSIETMGGISTPIIERNTTIPTKKSQIFSTAEDNQPAVDIHITQGERKFSKDNKSLGRFRLDGIPPASRGIPQIEVTFDLDANGILNVSAKDLGTGKVQNVTITSSSGLSKDEIEKMTADAEKYAEDDKKKSELVNLKNDAAHTAYVSEKSVDDNKDKISEELRSKVKTAANAVKDAANGDDSAKIKSALDELNKANAEVAAVLYKSNGGNAGANGQSMSMDDLKNIFGNAGINGFANAAQNGNANNNTIDV